MTIRRLSSREPEFLSTLDTLLHFDNSTDEAIERTVAEVLTNVRTIGDAAVLDYTRRFDRLEASLAIPTGSPLTSSPRPSTTSWRRLSCSVLTPRFLTVLPPASNDYCRPCRARM
jgi:hypothetical protein